MPIGHRPDLSSNEILFNMEFQLIPSKNEYEYPLTNRIIDFVKSQNFPIENLDTLSKIMASIEIYKKTYNKKEYDELDNLTDELNDKNEELTTKLNEQVEITNELLKKYNKQLKINEELSKEIKTQKELNDDICKKMFDMKEQLFTLETKN
jgi:predicted  nucleic acid-binding Zn-ribbon protein